VGVTLRGAERKLRVLVVAPYPTVPDNVGGKVRIVQLARGLARQGMDVRVLEPFVFGREFPSPGTDGLTHRRIRYPFLLPYLFTDRPFPYQFLASFHPGYASAITRDLAECDVVQFEHASFADLVDRIPPEKPIVYDAHNVEYDYVLSETSTVWARDLVGARIGRLERKLVSRATRILACSNQDKHRLSQLYGVPEQRIEVIPNGVRAILSGPAPTRNQLRPRRLADFQRIVLFSGSDVEHNRRAVRFILDRLVPGAAGDCAFVIKGACGRRFRGYRRDNVFFDETLGTIRAYATPGTVAINPVTQGSGTNLKLLDYLANGLQVVTTEFGLRGYDDLRQFVSVCPLEKFGAEIQRAHDAPAENAVEALQTYLWSHLASRVADLYRRLAQPGYPEVDNRAEAACAI
jgi:glycosyltransferase involved in cell wall biosynthesis